MTRTNARRVALLTTGVATVALSGVDAATGHVPAWEERLFRAVNRAPRALVLLWPVMQFGSLVAVPATAVATDRAVGRTTAGRVGVAGAIAWSLAKVVKRAVGRGRPADLLVGVELRERAGGLGFVSGHAAVATAMAVVLVPEVGRAAGTALTLATCWVPFGRMHVGAHLPHDVIGGVGLGLVIGSLARLGLPDRSTAIRSAPR